MMVKLQRRLCRRQCLLPKIKTKEILGNMKSKLRYIFSVIMLLVSVAVFSNGSAEAANQVKEFYQEKIEL